MVRPTSTNLTDSLPSAWNGKGPCMGRWAFVSISSSSRTSQSTSTATSSSSSSSLPVSSPRSRACRFHNSFFFLSSLVFLSHSVAIQFAFARVRSFYNGAGLSLKNSPPSRSRHPQGQLQGGGNSSKKGVRRRKTYEVNKPRFRPHWGMPRHREHKIKDDASGVLRRLHCLLDALRHFRGRERFADKRRSATLLAW